MTTLWHSGKVLHGDQTGRTIGFPTLNLDPHILILSHTKEGIYASWVDINEKKYASVLYLGPRLIKGEKNIVLEIHVMDFDEEIYDQVIKFSLEEYIRPIKNFDSLEELKEEIQRDVNKAMGLLR